MPAPTPTRWTRSSSPGWTRPPHPPRGAASPAPRHVPPLSAGELLAGYAARSLSPAEAVAELAAAIEADPHEAFWALCLDRAQDEARAAEDAWARGAARPLEG